MLRLSLLLVLPHLRNLAFGNARSYRSLMRKVANLAPLLLYLSR